MDNVEIGTLPPLVYGKLFGVLEFLIDEIKIVDNVSFESNTCDVVVQVQWWGEIVPTYVRPSRIIVLTKKNKPNPSSRTRFHSITYEIKTRLDLFKSYLRSYETMELAVYDQTENVVLGSAFLKNLAEVVFNNKILNLPIINYFGNCIGEMKIQFIFHKCNSSVSRTDESVAVPALHWSPEDLKINLSEINSGRDDCRIIETNRQKSARDFQHFISEDIRKQMQSLDISSQDVKTRDSLHYNSPVLNDCLRKADSISNEVINKEAKTLKSNHKNVSRNVILSRKSNIKDLNSKSVFTTSKNFKGSNLGRESQLTDVMKYRILPNKESLNDSSKVLYFNTKHNIESKLLSKSKKLLKSNPLKLSRKLQVSSKITNNQDEDKGGTSKGKAHSVTIEFKPENNKRAAQIKKIKEINQSKLMKHSIKQNFPKTLEKVSEEISRINKIVMTPPKSKWQVKSIDVDSDLEKIPVKEGKKKLPDAKVLDYLLGKEMTKEEEFFALNEFKRMSPCHNIVRSISNLCNSKACADDAKFISKGSFRNLSDNQNQQLQVNTKLKFDLNNPVEKLYFNTFFVDKFDRRQSEFEVAELLNKPENKFLLDRRKSDISSLTSSSELEASMKISSDREYCGNTVIARSCLLDQPLLEETKISDIDIIEDSRYGDCKKQACLNQMCDDSDEVLKDSTVPHVQPNGCLRCKYYKKLGELDKIIESLKVFEKRMIAIEKESETPFENKRTLTMNNECYLFLTEENSKSNTLTDLDFNGIQNDAKSIESIELEDTKLLLDDFNDDLDSSVEDSDFVEFSDYLAKSQPRSFKIQ